MEFINKFKNSISSAKNRFGKMSLKKKAVIIIVVLLVLGLSSRTLLAQKSSTPQYQTAQVQKGTIISTVNESGNVTSNSQAGVGSPTTGIVEEMYVNNGDEVAAGQNLFKVKSTASAQEIAQAWAAYQNSLVSENTAVDNKIVNQATLEKDRAAVISASSAVTSVQNSGGLSAINPATKQNYTQNDLDVLNSNLVSARETFAADEQKYNHTGQNIGAADASANSAWLAYQATQDSIVTAPIDGTVANISAKPGDQVTASAGTQSSNNNNSSSTAASSGSSNAILSIGNFSTPYIKVQTSEVDVTSLKPDQKATITLSAFPDKTFVGTVDLIDTAGTITTGVVTYNAYITFVSPPPDIKPGMSASVTIQTARHDDVLSVPTTAIQTTSGTPTVRVLKNGQVTSVEVETGITSDADTEILSGLSEGETVITGSASTGSGAGGASVTSPFGRGIGGFGGGGAVFRAGGGGARGN
jgi:RND family efflux transporter MFP subunit